MSRYQGISNPLNLSPPSSDDESAYIKASKRRFAAKQATATSSNYDSSSRSKDRSGTHTTTDGGLHRQAAMNSAAQSSSRRARGHSSNMPSSYQSSSHPDRGHERNLRHMKSDYSFESGPDEVNRSVRKQKSPGFAPEAGIDLSSFDNSCGSYRHASSRPDRNMDTYDRRSTVHQSSSRREYDSASTARQQSSRREYDSASTAHQSSSRREHDSGSTIRQPSHRHHEARRDAPAYDLSSMSGMPESIYEASPRQHHNKRRQGQYYGSTNDRSTAQSGSSAIPNRFDDGSSSDSY